MIYIWIFKTMIKLNGTMTEILMISLLQDDDKSENGLVT